MTKTDPAIRRPLVHWLMVGVAAFLVALAWLHPLDRRAEDDLKAGLKRALTTYAVTRTINGIISVAQETGVSVQPGGVGMTFAPGQLLDPLNDLVEQVSSVMLAVTVSFGIQLVLLHLGGSGLVSAMLTTVAVACIVRWWQHRRLHPWAWRLLAALVLVRFAVPFAASGSELAYRYAMADQYAAAQGELEGVGAAAGAASPANRAGSGAAATPSRSFWEILRAVPRQWGESHEDAQQERGRLEQLRGRIDDAVEHLLRLVSIFVVHTVLLPLLILGVMGRLLFVLPLAKRP